MKPKKQPTGITPIPAVFHRADTPDDVAAKPWTFQPGTGSTSMDSRDMEIPLDDSEESAGVRAHEMLHVALSPYDMGETDLDFATLAAEDGRVETLATAAGVKRPMPISRQELRETLDGAPESRLSALAIASTGAPTESIVREWLAEHSRDDVADLMDWAHDAYLSGRDFEATRKVASRVRGLSSVGRSITGESAPEAPKGTLFGHGRPLPPTLTAQPSGERVTVAGGGTGRKKTPQEPRMLLPVKVDDYEQPHAEDGRWSTMDIQTPPLTVHLSDVRGSLRTRATTDGTVPRRLYRIQLDGKVFTARKHKRQGTVLIDASGSMSLDVDDIAEFVRSAPAAVVAAYWGDMDSTTGTLRVLADNGRMAQDRQFVPDGGGNEVDGPALWWLSRQRAPRIWVSDGGITGVYDESPSEAMEDEVATIVRRARIRQIDPSDMDDWQKAVTKALR